VIAELLPAPAWNHSARVYIQGDKKLLTKTSENTVELYDLRQDPGEKHNLSQGAAEAVTALKRELAAFIAAVPRG
jgi:arylsulfatase A-like enzyme